jgi:small subunit ribosomal protein S8
VKRKSRPGRRIYVGYERIPKVLNGMGISIVSTSRGLMTDKTARDEKVGGELLCEVW